MMDAETNSLWENAVDLPFPCKDGKDNHRLYLIWTIGKYANGCPWVALRAIYTNKSIAMQKARDIRKYEIPNQIPRGMVIERVHVEPRVTNHPYGEQMLEACAHAGLI